MDKTKLSYYFNIKSKFLRKDTAKDVGKAKRIRKKKKIPGHYSDKMLKKILTKLKKKYYPICKEARRLFKESLKKFTEFVSRNSASKIREHEIEVKILSHRLNLLVMNLKYDIINEFDIPSWPDFQRLVSSRSQENINLHILTTEIKRNIDLSFQGIKLSIHLVLPSCMTTRNLFKMYQENMWKKVKSFNDFMYEKERGTPAEEIVWTNFPSYRDIDIDTLKKYKFNCNKDFHELHVFDAIKQVSVKRYPMCKGIIKGMKIIFKDLIIKHFSCKDFNVLMGEINDKLKLIKIEYGGSIPNMIGKQIIITDSDSFQDLKNFLKEQKVYEDFINPRELYESENLKVNILEISQNTEAFY